MEQLRATLPGLRGGTADIIRALDGIRVELEAAQRLFVRYRSSIDAIGAVVSDVRSGVDWGGSVARWMLVAAGFLYSAGQVVPITFGRRLIRLESFQS